MALTSQNLVNHFVNGEVVRAGAALDYGFTDALGRPTPDEISIPLYLAYKDLILNKGITASMLHRHLLGGKLTELLKSEGHDVEVPDNYITLEPYYD